MDVMLCGLEDNRGSGIALTVPYTVVTCAIYCMQLFCTCNHGFTHQSSNHPYGLESYERDERPTYASTECGTLYRYLQRAYTLYMLPVTVGRSSSDNSAIRYVVINTTARGLSHH